MTTTLDAPTTTKLPKRKGWKAARKLRSGHSLYWWAEVVYVLLFYVVYSFVRNSKQSNKRIAFRHARQIISFEKTLRIYDEQSLHHWARGIRALIIASNYFYGSLHFIVTIGVGIFLFRKFPDHYARWRNTIAIATTLALIGFFSYELMPPRLLPPSFGYIDTLAKYPAFWSFSSGTMSKLSNQFAAMPSVHCCWAAWSACALFPRVHTTWAKTLAVLYPCGTVAVIVFTANHYFVDALGGFFILFVGYHAAQHLTRAGRMPAPVVPT